MIKSREEGQNVMIGCSSWNLPQESIKNKEKSMCEMAYGFGGCKDGLQE